MPTTSEAVERNMKSQKQKRCVITVTISEKCLQDINKEHLIYLEMIFFPFDRQR